MSFTNVQVAIAAALVTGAALPRARVRFDLQAAGIDGGIVVPGTPAVADLDADGLGTVGLWGGPGAKYTVTITSEQGRVQFTGEASVPAYDCNLHEILDLDLPAPSDAEAAVLRARDWAIKTGAPVENGEYSAKHHALAAKADRETTVEAAAAAASDRQQTGLDRIQTGLDRSAAEDSAEQSRGNMLTAVAQAALAVAMAAASASAAQQDLSGVSAAALHRSPNAIVDVRVYDTSKDSDGGAWIERMAGRSWMSEPFVGSWLPGTAYGFVGIANELQARCHGATVGPELISTEADRTFSSDTGFWTKGTGWAITGGRAVHSGGTPEYLVRLGFYAAAGVYKWEFDVAAADATNFVQVYDGSGTAYGPVIQAPGHYVVYVPVVANGAARLRGVGNCSVDNVSIKQVTGFTTLSGSYYQLQADGKFYRLWTNVLGLSEFPTGTAGLNAASGGFVTGSTLNGYDGAIAIGFDGVNQQVATKLVGTQYAGMAGLFSLVVQMDDGNAPSFGSATAGSALNDFRFTLGGANGLNPNSATVTPLGSNQYRVSIVIPTISTASSFGIVKEPTNSSRTFKTSGWQLTIALPGTTPVFDSYEKKATADTGQSEVFRGNKAKFPRMAALVLEASRLVIYDLQEPGRPMWKVITKGQNATLSGAWDGNNSNNGVSANAREGVVCIATSAAGTMVLDFGADRVLNYYSGTASYRWSGNLGNANVPAPKHLLVGVSMPPTGAHNAIGMCVMPDAPVEPTTGLAVPTIAIGTNAGVAVVKHDGTVVSSTSGLTYTSVDIRPEILWAGRGANSASQMYALRPGQLANAFALLQYNEAAVPDYILVTTDRAAVVVTGGRATTGRMANITSTDRTGPMLERLRGNEISPALGMASRIASTYATGWMVGDVRRCLLADIYPGVVSDVNLCANGTFGTNLDGWSQLGGFTSTAAIVAGEMQVTATAPSGVQAYAFASVPGKTFKVTANARMVSGGGSAYIGFCSPTGGDIANSFSSSTSSAVAQPMVAYVTATDVITRVFARVTNSGSVGAFDNFVVAEVASDRSYKYKPATVVGTLTRTAVAAAAQLVMWGGWSDANYVQEAYSADLDFASGCSVPVWASVGVASAIGLNAPAPGGVGPAVTYLPLASFPATPVALSMNGAQWSKQTGWSCPTANSFALDGSAGAAQTQLQQVTGNTPTAGTVRRWTLTISTLALNGGTLSVFPNNGSPFTVAAPGTYTGIGDAATCLLRASGGTGVQCTGTLAVDELAPAIMVDRSAAAGPFWRLGMNALGFLVGEAFDGATLRTVVSSVNLANAGTFLAEMSLGPQGTLALKVNAEQVGQTTGAPLATLANASAVLTIGNSRALNQPWTGGLALLKPSGTVPTDDQARFAFQQEREMFGAGVQITLPDNTTLVDGVYDDGRDAWRVGTSGYEAEFVGLVRTFASPVAVGTISRVAGRSGVRLVARAGTQPGVDVTMPSQNLKEELLRRAEDAARIQMPLPPLDWQGAFTATTINGSALLTVSAGSLVLPVGATLQGARISGTGIPAGATVLAVSGAQVQMSAPATATSAGVTVSVQDLILPMGQSPHLVCTAGAGVQEGTGKAWNRGFDGFRERVMYGSAPGNQWLQVETRRAAA